MAEDLFEGLPPPQPSTQSKEPCEEDLNHNLYTQPNLKSALKRPSSGIVPDNTSGKRLRFNTLTDTSEAQVIEAMQKIISHIKNPSKFERACKLSMQLIEAGSVTQGTINNFFAILEASMFLPTPCTHPSVRRNFHALFSAAQDATHLLNVKQKMQLAVWNLLAILANDLFTDDGFVFSRAACQIREAISKIPHASEEDDNETSCLSNKTGRYILTGGCDETSSVPVNSETDPFGLDALFNNDKGQGGQSDRRAISVGVAEEDTKGLLNSKREALITCLEIAAQRYRASWCQTAIDILMKHAYDNAARFTRKQRNVINRLWSSIREQQIRRKQGKSIGGKLDVTAFEWLQEKYASEKISIRRSVGASGDHQAEQWLG